MEQVVRTVFEDLQKGKPNRRLFGAQFNHVLTDAKVRSAARRLKRFGSPREVHVLATRERGGMEVTTTRLTFKSVTLEVVRYRQPDGTIEQFFVSRE